MSVFRNDYSLVGALLVAGGIGFGLLNSITPASAPKAATVTSTDDKTETIPRPSGDVAPARPFMFGDGVTVVSPTSTNFLNPDHIRSVQETDQYSGVVLTNSVPIANSGSVPSSSSGFLTNAAPVFVPPNPLPAKANWTWDVQDKEFTNVVITKIEADRVSITSDTGPVRIDIAVLPHELQKLLKYDPILAAQAAAARRAAAPSGP